MLEQILDFFAAVIPELPGILPGVLVTLATVTLALGLGLLLGIPMAMFQVYGNRPLRFLVAAFVWFFRGTPLLVLLFIFHLGIFVMLKWDVPPFVSSCLVLGLASTAYQSQIFRGAIESIPQGQLKASRALGMYDTQGILAIVMPQAVRVALPGWSNEFSILLKDSALVYLLGTPDIMANVYWTASRTSYHFTFYIVGAALYFAITVIGIRLLRMLERKVHIPGYESNM